MTTAGARRLYIRMQSRRKKIDNRRRVARHPWKGSAAFWWSAPYFHKRIMKAHRGAGELRDLSGGGLSLLTDQRLAPRQLITITVPLSKPNLQIPTLAYVRWSRPLRGSGRYAAGLSFVV